MSSNNTGWSVDPAEYANSSGVGGNTYQTINNLVVGCLSVLKCVHFNTEDITINGENLLSTIRSLSFSNPQRAISALSYQFNTLNTNLNSMSEIHWDTISNLSYRTEYIHTFLSRTSDNNIYLGNSQVSNKIYIGFPNDEIYLQEKLHIMKQIM